MLYQRACKKARKTCNAVPSLLRKLYWGMQGLEAGRGTKLPKLHITWPHQVRIGEYCTLEPDTYFKFDEFWKLGPCIMIGNYVFIGKGCEFNIIESISIGNYSLISSGCKFVDHNHGMERGKPMQLQAHAGAPIILEEDVWLGVNVVVLKGVHICQGAVVGANSVVTKSIPPYEVWCGSPAKKIKDR